MMASSIVLPSATHTSTWGAPRARRQSYTLGPDGVVEQPPPPLPPRRNTVTVSTAPQQSLGKKLQLIAKKELFSIGKTTQTANTKEKMDSRYYRPASPRGRISNPARSSTGTFDPYYDANYYGRPRSPRSSAERVGGSLYAQHDYPTSSSSGSRSSKPRYDSYSGRPRRNTLNDSDDRLARPSTTLAPPTALPLRTHATHATHAHDRPSSPLARSWDNRAETYNSQPAPRREHKRIYSVDDGSHSAKLIAEKDIIKPSHRDSRDYSVTSGGRTYHQHKPLVKATEFGDEGFSYTDPAAMYRETEPAWRRPRAGSIERGARPSSVILDRGPRSSARDLGPPPSTRGFDKIPINGSSSRHHGRSSSIERSRDIPKYDSYPDAAPSRTSSTRHHAPAIHQEPRDTRRETYHDDYDRRDREIENRRYADRYEDRDVASRGFGIAPAGHVREPSLDRAQPAWTAPEVGHGRSDGYGSQYYSSDRAEARMPEARIPREREVAPTYDERPRERERASRESSQPLPSAAPVVAGAAAGAAATFGAAHVLKNRERERERDRDQERDRERERERVERERERERELEKEREQRKEWDERDRRGRGSDERERRPDRRDAVPEDRKDRPSEERTPPPGAYPQEPDRKPRERGYEEKEDPERRERRSRKAPSSDGSGDERPRHYIDSKSGRGSERRTEPSATEPALDPDEEYRRRIQQEAERSGAGRDRDSDSDRERDRRRRKEERDKSRERAEDHRSREPKPSVAEPQHSRYDERSASVLDKDIVQEPDALADHDPPSKAVQIVAPPKEAPPAPKGILRKPTEKFPEDPEPIREGVAPHKSQLKGKDIPPNARWTKIDRRLVNPQALEDAKERFEERLDCVIVLRVLTKEDIQKLADRTRKIREMRGEFPT